MGFKKVLTVFFALVFVISLSSCKKLGWFGNEVKLTDEVLLENIDVYSSTNSTVNTMQITSTEGLTIIGGEVSYGLLQVRNTSLENGLLSLRTGDMIVPFTNKAMTVTYQTDTNLGAYAIISWTATGTTSIYNMFGDLVLAEGNYYSYNLSFTTENVIQDDHYTVDTLYYENVTYLKNDDYTLGNLKPTKIITLVDPVTGDRTTESPFGYAHGDDYEAPDYSNNALDLVNLNKYYLDIRGGIYYISKKSDNSLVSSFEVPTATMMASYDKHIVYQEVYGVSEYETDYTYSLAGQKYKVETASIDIVSGKTKYIDVNYVINSFDEFCNKDHVYMQGLANVSMIEDKVLLTDRTYDYLIGTDAKLLNDVTMYDFANLRVLDSTHLFNTSTRVVSGLDMVPLFTLSSTYAINMSAKVIKTTYDGLYGLIDFDGKVLTSFEYSQIFTSMLNGSTFGTSYGAHGFVNVDGSFDEFENDYYGLAGCAILSVPESADTTTGLYTCLIQDYDQNELGEIQVSSSTFSSGISNTVFGANYCYRFAQNYPAPNHYLYVFFDVNVESSL